MELLRSVSNTQFLFPAAAVAVVLVCTALVFIFGFHSAEQPQFDKLPLVVDDRKSAKSKRKGKDKKSSPNRTASDEGKAKSESSKKSPAKEKKKEEVKEEKPKPKEKPVEPKIAKKEAPVDKKAKKGKAVDAEKPADFDDGVWEEVPKKERKPAEKKKPKEEPAKKESPAKNKSNKKQNKSKEADNEAAQAEESSEEVIKVVSVSSGPQVSEEATLALQAQVEELQRILKERERQEQAATGGGDTADDDAELPEFLGPKLRCVNRPDNPGTRFRLPELRLTASLPHLKKVNEAPKLDSVDKESPESDKPDDKTNAPVFDELGDTWAEAKTSKKSKKKARKDQ
ncbi:hypothetical protein NE865_02597 [Phthorimaea operculella]|nr:hypothetical protein NE865_02597 [Phthorimaea operculella]